LAENAEEPLIRGLEEQEHLILKRHSH